jgi:hypothetical protein
MKKIIILTCAIVFCFAGKAQIINIPLGSKPVIDGFYDYTEWNDSKIIDIYVQTDWSVTVLFKHSDTSLYFAFTEVKGILGERYPDVMFDINNDKDSAWASDDWWLHASYNDCEANGTYNIWSSCQPTHTGWWANNFPLSSGECIEMEISYQKLGIAPGSNDTIGMAMEVSNTFDDYDYYPYTAEISHPSTWGNFVLSQFSSTNENQRQNINVSVFPNPSANFTRFTFPNPGNKTYSLSIYSANGQLLQSTENIKGHEITIENSGHTKGMYFYQLQEENGNFARGKFIIN